VAQEAYQESEWGLGLNIKQPLLHSHGTIKAGESQRITPYFE
jgi:hypothetical protein